MKQAETPKRVGRSVGLGWTYYGQGAGNPLTLRQTLIAYSLVAFPFAILFGLTVPAVPPKLEVTAVLLFAALCGLFMTFLFAGNLSEGVYLGKKGVRITWGDLLPARTRFFAWPEIKAFDFDGMRPFMETWDEYVPLPGIDDLAVTRPDRAERMLTAMNRSLAAQIGAPSPPETRIPDRLTPEQTAEAKAKVAAAPTRSIFYLLGSLALLGTGAGQTAVVLILFVIVAEVIVHYRHRKIDTKQPSS